MVISSQSYYVYLSIKHGNPFHNLLQCFQQFTATLSASCCNAFSNLPQCLTLMVQSFCNTVT